MLRPYSDDATTSSPIDAADAATPPRIDDPSPIDGPAPHHPHTARAGGRRSPAPIAMGAGVGGEGRRESPSPSEEARDPGEKKAAPAQLLVPWRHTEPYLGWQRRPQSGARCW